MTGTTAAGVLYTTTDHGDTRWCVECIGHVDGTATDPAAQEQLFDAVEDRDRVLHARSRRHPNRRGGAAACGAQLWEAGGG